MSDDRRAWLPGGTYFFTVNLLERYGNDLLTRHIDVLRDIVRNSGVRVNCLSNSHRPRIIKRSVKALDTV